MQITAMNNLRISLEIAVFVVTQTLNCALFPGFLQGINSLKHQCLG